MRTPRPAMSFIVMLAVTLVLVVTAVGLALLRGGGPETDGSPAAAPAAPSGTSAAGGRRFGFRCQAFVSE